MEKNKAYSLAEALLTIGLIAVIGLLTVSTLRGFSDEKEYVAGTKKAFKTLDSATSSLQIKKTNWTESIFADYSDVLSGMTHDTDYTIKDLAGNEVQDGEGNTKKIDSSNSILATDGMIWVPESATGKALKMIVDVNGAAPPNVQGLDVQEFVVDTDGNVEPSGNCTSYIVQYEKLPWLDDSSLTECPAP